MTDMMAPLRTVTSSSPIAGFQERSEVTLGIDFGSTSTRAYLWCRKTKVGWYVESKGKATISPRFLSGDFSSIGYPFDGGEVYLGQKSDAARESISLKYAFYVLVNTSDEIFDQYRMATPLRRQNDQGLHNRLLGGLNKLFTTIYERVSEVCEEEKLHVTTIGLSIPSQWTLDFVDLYRRIVAQAFRHAPSAIHFVTETEALAHFLCVKKLDRLVALRNTVHHGVVLVLDFGGHNMNTCTLNIVCGGDRAPAFYLIGEPEGADGGSELWEYLVAEMSLKYVQHEYKIAPSAQMKQRLLDSFNSAKGGCGPEFPGEGFYCAVKDRRGKTYNIDFDEVKITNCFDQAVALPLALARDRTEELKRLLAFQEKIHTSADIPVEKPRVILAGGTARHEGIRRRIQDICQRNGISDPVMTDDIVKQYDSVKIASGTAFAVASPLTIEQFMERGAAFGLQMRQRPKRDETESEHQWDNTAPFLFSMRKAKKAFKRFVTGNDELKIVCDPFFEDESNENKDHLDYHRCYDLADLGRPTQGYWWFTLALTGHGDQMRLTIERWRRPPRSHKKLACEPITVPLHYNKGSNSIHIGDEACDASRYISRLKEYPERDQKTPKKKESPLLVPEKRRLTARRTATKTSKKTSLVATDSKKAAQALNTGSQPMKQREASGGDHDASDDSRNFSFINRRRWS